MEETSQQDRGDQLAELRLHNSLLPISTLPVEVLLKVLTNAILSSNWFHNPAHTFPPPSDTPTVLLQDHFGTWSYRSVEQVCHHWRQVVLAYPAIWVAKIETSDSLELHEAWWNELYRRSDPLPCRFAISYCEDQRSARPGYYPQITQQIQQYLHRVNSLSVTITDRGVFLENYFPFAQSTPTLETLEIWIMKNYLEGGLQFDGRLHELCRLKSLYLYWVSFDPSIFDSASFSQLRTLHVRQASSNIRRPTVEEWWGIFRYLPFLESLYIKDLNANSDNIDRASRIPHRLQHLQDLILDLPCRYMSLLLSEIAIPSTCQLKLSVNQAESGRYFEALATWIHCHLNARAEVQLHPSWSFLTSNRFMEFAEITDDVDKLFRCSFRFQRDSVDAMVNVLIPAIRPILTHALVVDLQFRMPTTSSELNPSLAVIYGVLIRNFSAVQELVNPSPFELPLSLCMEDEENIMLPNLAQMTFRNHSFVIAAGDEESDITRDLRHTLPDDYIRWRLRVGRPIVIIVIERCDGAAYAVQRLKAITGLHIIWDGS